MCGIIGYIGEQQAIPFLIDGLRRLEYRGYDSSGVAVKNGDLSVHKKIGKVADLEASLPSKVEGTCGIAHTRWATHGIPNEKNAHPQLSGNKKIAIVHNGIIENFNELKKELSENGVIFRSQTDSEVIAHLIEHYFKDDLYAAVKQATERLKGAYALAVIAESQPDQFIVARKGSPLIIGIGKNENYVSSDINAITTHTKDVIFLEDNEMGIITQNKVTIKNGTNKEINKKITHIDWSPSTTEKKGYNHFMLKEVFEQPTVIRTILNKYIKKNTIVFSRLQKSTINYQKLDRFIIQSCGTSWHSGLISKYWIENMAHILTEVDISSEFRYRQIINQGTAIIIAISQSGETADTLACLREAKSKFFKILSFVNVKNSSMDRESNDVIYSHSGQEIGVASTKNYTAQLTTLYLFSLYISLLNKKITSKELTKKLTELNKIPDYIEQLLDQKDAIKKIANKYYLSREFLFIGRGVNYPSALEGALKLKEISYIHATGYAAGELKHGPIALIDSKLPVVCIAPNTSTYEKMISNIQEVKSRKGKVIAVATEGNQDIQKTADDVIYIPNITEELTPLLVAIPLQLLAYYIAIKLDCDVDQPRNLAKSVTVE